MNEDTNLYNNKRQRPTVTSVGNAWVICDSKSRPGYKYYFNTVSAQSVWNLSPEDIEKAKKFTKALPRSEIEKCPEPVTDPPMDPSAQPTRIQPFNDQTTRQLQTQPNILFPMNLLNNGLHANINNLPGMHTNLNNLTSLPTNLNMLGLPTNVNMSGLPTNVNMSGLPTNVNMSALPSNMNMLSGLTANLNTISGLHTNMTNGTQLPASTELSNIGGLHPFIWNNPAGNQVQNQPIIYVVAQPTAGFPTQQISQHNNTYENNENTKKDIKAFHNNFSRSKGSGSNFNKSDLRYKLSRRRSKSASGVKSYQSFRTEDTGFRSNNQSTCLNDDGLEETSKYDLTILDCLKPHNSVFLNWFIVVDTKTILENFAFLNKVIDPDQNCFLLVPDHIMCELQEIVSGSGEMATRRILRFLNQHIESEIAFRGDLITGVDDNTYKMLITCENLAEQNNVVLLSNDPKYEGFRSTNKNIHVFTLKQFKQILNNKGTRRPPKAKSPTLSIKIQVPNDHHSIDDRSTTSHPHDYDIQSQKSSPEAIQSHSQPSIIKAAQNVQTHNETRNDRASQHLETNVDEVDTPIPPAKTQEAEEKVNLQTPAKNDRRHITLTRSISNITNTTESTQAKYRWRKKRNNSAKTEATNVCSIEKTDNKNQTRQETPNFVDAGNLSQECDKQISPIRAQSVERSSISSYHKAIERPNITIEETSTSGIISNSPIACSVNRKDSVSSAKETVSVCDDVNFVRHQVDGQSMEEVLRTRREEWVLRFVQIMEEALREMLRENCPNDGKGYDYSPPWATDLPELSRCIIKKFSDHFNVVDAANRLSFTLHRISDGKGNLSTKIEPHQFMDMYSYGVYLIDSLKQVSVDCEDLNVTEQSLKKLLYDIRNPNQDCIHNETFLDEPNESVANVAGTGKEVSQIRTRSRTQKQNAEQIPSCRNSNSSQMFSTRVTQNNTESQQRQFENTETNFFSSLLLQKKNSEISFNSPNSTPNSARIAQTPSKVFSSRTPSMSPKVPNIKVRTPEVESNIKKDVPKEDSNKTSKDATDSSNPPGELPSTATAVQIVRKFTNIAQFEEKLKEIQYDDYDEYYDENEPYEANDDEFQENGDVEDGAQEDGLLQEDREYHQDNEFSEEYEEKKEMTLNTKNLDVEKKNARMNFKYFLKEEFRKPIQLVRELCAKVVEDIKEARKPSIEMQNKLKTAYTTISKMKNSLKSILDRDSPDEENNITGLIEKANLQSYNDDTELLTQYTNIVKECVKQIDTWHQIVTQVMAACGIQQVT